MKRNLRFYTLILFGGLLFGFGMGLSQMAKPEFILNFLQLEDTDLLLVLISAAATTGIFFEIGDRKDKKAPLTSQKRGKRKTALDRKVIFGGIVFGIGWGLAGVCPGISYASLGLGNYPIIASIAGMFSGAYIQGRIRS